MKPETFIDLVLLIAGIVATFVVMWIIFWYSL